MVVRPVERAFTVADRTCAARQRAPAAPNKRLTAPDSACSVATPEDPDDWCRLAPPFAFHEGVQGACYRRPLGYARGRYCPNVTITRDGSAQGLRRRGREVARSSSRGHDHDRTTSACGAHDARS